MVLLIQSVFDFFLSRLGKATSILQFEIIFVDNIEEKKNKLIH